MVEEAARAPQSEPNSMLDKAVVFDGRTYAMHPRHWYEDGSFGFIVESTAFLLHRSLLARKSSVMADMFSLPQSASSPAEASDHLLETINGIPFIVLHDKAEDFSNVLDIIYANIILPDDRSDLGATALMGIIQFANKYLFDKVKEWGVSRILSSHALLVVEHKELRSSLQDGSYSSPKFCVQVIQFARECSLPQFLPLAFYALATVNWDQKSRDDFFAMDQLSDGDRWRIQEGRSALLKAVVRQAYNMPENGCTRERCAQTDCLKGLPDLWIDPPLRWMELQLHPLEEIEFRLSLTYTLCSVCYLSLRNRTQALRDDLVRRLAEFFQIND
ncbi:hypothetical protein FS837_005155 [Tulasnella sp. UAMH 9824]|nr:hypothetical protein FS837_005155 [Tulasnella sp. UAMH 9824]